VQNPGKMPQKVQKLYVLVSDSLMQVSFAGFLSLPALYVVVCTRATSEPSPIAGRADPH
jgi:hypothetical protein